MHEPINKSPTSTSSSMDGKNDKDLGNFLLLEPEREPFDLSQGHLTNK